MHEPTFTLRPRNRETLTRKRATDLFAPASARDYAAVHVGGCAIGDAAAGVAGVELRKLAARGSVRSVVLADCIASLPEEEALRSLSTLCAALGTADSLEEVDLSDNALGSRGLAACAPVLGGGKLRSVVLSNNGLAADSARLVKGFLCPGKVTALRVLHIHNNCMESAGLVQLAAIVAASPELEDLRLSSLRAGADATRAVADALEATSSLVALDLSDNTLDGEGACALGTVLTKQSRLARLVLRDMIMGNDAVAVLVAPLVHAEAPLEMLDLSGNDLSSSAVGNIVSLVRAKGGTLKTLLLEENELGDRGAVRFARAMAPDVVTALQVVSIAANGVRGVGAVALAASLKPLPAFQTLLINGNMAPPHVVQRIKEALGAALGPVDDMEEYEEAEEVEEEEAVSAEEAEAEVEDLGSALERLSLARSPAKPPLPATSSSPSKPKPAVMSRLISIFSSSRDGTSEPPSSTVEEVSSAADVAQRSGDIEDGDMVEPRTPDLTVLSSAPTIGDDASRSSVQGNSSQAEGAEKGNLPVASENSRQAMFESARKLREQVAAMSREVTAVVGELSELSASPGGAMLSRRISLASPIPAGSPASTVAAEFLLVGGAGGKTSRRRTLFETVIDVLGGLLVGLFVVILVLAIAQSQEEATFPYRPV